MLQTLKGDTHPQVRAQSQTRVAEVQMWVYPQDEIKSHHQELQVFLSCGSSLQDKNPVAIFNGSMVRCSVPESKRNPP